MSSRDIPVEGSTRRRPAKGFGSRFPSVRSQEWFPSRGPTSKKRDPPCAASEESTGEPPACRPGRCPPPSAAAWDHAAIRGPGDAIAALGVRMGDLRGNPDGTFDRAPPAPTATLRVGEDAPTPCGFRLPGIRTAWSERLAITLGVSRSPSRSRNRVPPPTGGVGHPVKMDRRRRTNAEISHPRPRVRIDGMPRSQRRDLDRTRSPPWLQQRHRGGGRRGEDPVRRATRSLVTLRTSRSARGGLPGSSMRVAATGQNPAQRHPRRPRPPQYATISWPLVGAAGFA